MEQNKNIIYLAGGCFWGMEKLMQSIPGVLDAVSGYANGTGEQDADYKTVCTGKTGFREAVAVTYDPNHVTLDQLLFAYFEVVDPTAVNRQGHDVGTQYQAGIYYANEDAKMTVERILPEALWKRYLANEHPALSDPSQVTMEHVLQFQQVAAPVGATMHIGGGLRIARLQVEHLIASHQFPAATLASTKIAHLLIGFEFDLGGNTLAGAHCVNGIRLVVVLLDHATLHPLGQQRQQAQQGASLSSGWHRVLLLALWQMRPPAGC